jgi:hypothetical protein
MSSIEAVLARLREANRLEQQRLEQRRLEQQSRDANRERARQVIEFESQTGIRIDSPSIGRHVDEFKRYVRKAPYSSTLPEFLIHVASSEYGTEYSFGALC